MNLILSYFLFLLTVTFGELLNGHNKQGKRIIRRIESTEKKIINANLTVVFNQECSNEKVNETTPGRLWKS